MYFGSLKNIINQKTYFHDNHSYQTRSEGWPSYRASRSNVGVGGDASTSTMGLGVDASRSNIGMGGDTFRSNMGLAADASTSNLGMGVAASSPTWGWPGTRPDPRC
jgi:hypothetical protein